MQIHIIQLHTQSGSETDLLFIGTNTYQAVRKVVAEFLPRLEEETDIIALNKVIDFKDLQQWFAEYCAYYSAELVIQWLYK